MKIVLNRDFKNPIHVDRIRVVMDEDVEFSLKVNNEGHLEITKISFASGSGGIKVLPKLSNEIAIH